MIVWVGTRGFADREHLARAFGVSPSTIRKYCQPEMHDRRTGRALYDEQVVALALTEAGVIARPERQGVTPRRVTRRKDRSCI